MNCVLCFHTHRTHQGYPIKADGVFEGASLCFNCQTDILNRADGIMFDTSDRFHLQATIKHQRSMDARC